MNEIPISFEEEYPEEAEILSKLIEEGEVGNLFSENEPIKREFPKIGRNDPCPCNSGKKYKKCCFSA
jgi:uncharacterized protein YecA (UPF0149 family)